MALVFPLNPYSVSASHFFSGRCIQDFHFGLHQYSVCTSPSSSYRSVFPRKTRAFHSNFVEKSVPPSTLSCPRLMTGQFAKKDKGGNKIKGRQKVKKKKDEWIEEGRKGRGHNDVRRGGNFVARARSSLPSPARSSSHR